MEKKTFNAAVTGAVRLYRVASVFTDGASTATPSITAGNEAVTTSTRTLVLVRSVVNSRPDLGRQDRHEEPSMHRAGAA